MTISQYTRDVDALYVYTSEGVPYAPIVDRTIPVSDDVMLDFDDEGRLLGIEILSASEVLGSELLDKHIHAKPRLLEVYSAEDSEVYASALAILEKEFVGVPSEPPMESTARLTLGDLTISKQMFGESAFSSPI